jgi:hypothetical protein
MTITNKDELDDILKLIIIVDKFKDPSLFTSYLLDDVEEMVQALKEPKVEEVEQPKDEIITKLKYGGTYIEKKQNVKPNITIDDKIKKLENELEKEYSFTKEERVKELYKLKGELTKESKVKSNKLSKEEIKEIDEKIKKLEAKNSNSSYCPKDLEEIERLYKLKNKEKEEKFKKNIKNGKIVETEEHKELLKKYNELEKNRWVQDDIEGNKKREEEVRKIQKKLEFQKSIFVEDKEYKLFYYSQKFSYRSVRCIIISETDKFYKILPIERVLTHFDDKQTAHYKYEYPIIIREDKVIKYNKKRFLSPVEYYREDKDYSLCD